MESRDTGFKSRSGCIDKAAIRRLAGKYDLDLLVLLGSYGTEHFAPGRSDIDLAFLSRKRLQSDEHLQLIMELSALFQHGKIDLIDLEKASGLLKYEVATRGRSLFHSKKGFFERYRLYCLRYYYDTAKFRVLQKEYFHEQLRVLKDEQSGS